MPLPPPVTSATLFVNLRIAPPFFIATTTRPKRLAVPSTQSSRRQPRPIARSTEARQSSARSPVRHLHRRRQPFWPRNPLPPSQRRRERREFPPKQPARTRDRRAAS